MLLDGLMINVLKNALITAKTIIAGGLMLNAGSPHAASRTMLPISIDFTRLPGLIIFPATQKETIVPMEASRLLTPTRVSL